VALLDLMLPDGSGFDVGVALRGLVPNVRIVLLSEHVQPRILWALPAGERPYWSYLLKSGITSADALCAAIKVLNTNNRSTEVDRTRHRHPGIAPGMASLPTHASANRHLTVPT